MVRSHVALDWSIKLGMDNLVFTKKLIFNLTMPQLDFTVWSVSVIFTAIAIFVGVSTYHLDSESD